MSARSEADRIADVKRIVEAARAVVRHRAEIAGAIASTTGLSPEGVELGLTRHLELDPTDEELASLVREAGSAKHVAVILSANVFVAALRAIAIARAASPSVVVRPSRREPHFARALVARAKDDGLRIDDALDVEKLVGGEAHVYGRDATIASVRARVGGRVRVRGHGAGMGIAMITPAASLDTAARALADDVIAFDQRGCLSPRIAIALGDEARAQAFGEAMHAALGEAAARVPRGALADDERAEGVRYASTMAYAGRLFEGASHVVGVASSGAPLLVPPPGRHLHVVPAADLIAARALVDPIGSVIIAVGSDEPVHAAALAPPHARLSKLGAMQRPPLDGPVDRRVR